ncbi:MAG: glycosyltransferase family 39 protein [Tumebacillaceae bacterium]
MTTKGWLWTLLLVSLLLKIVVVLTSGASYDLHSDDRSYLETARIWLETGTFTYNDPTRPTVFITPAYPAFLAVLMKIIGPGFAMEQTVRILQAVMVTAALYVLFQIGRKLFSEKAAVVAVGMTAFYIPLWLVSNLLLTEAMFVLALLLLIDSALLAMEDPTPKRALLFGLVWVAAIYIRPTIALWPGLFFLLLLSKRKIPWAQLLKCGGIVAVVLILCLMPWWVRNYEVSGGHFIALTKAGGNPLLLGTFPYGLPPLEEQRTWHATNDLWVNDEFDAQWAKERIKDGFSNSFWKYLSWYTFGKFGKFWGEAFYWLPVAGIPAVLVWVYHYAILLPSFWGMWKARKIEGAQAVVLLLAYFSVLHMIYLAHGRYSAPLMPIMALFTAYAFLGRAKKGSLRVK